MKAELTINEIYPSVQGESSYAGLPCTFVRLTGCPLRCQWCDTVYAFHRGQSMSIAEILAEVNRHGLSLVEVTGGEPLAQPAAKDLIDALVAEGFKVLLETSGSESVKGLSPELHIIMDLKCPGSGMEDNNLWENLDHLKASDEVKLVIKDEKDFQWAREKLAIHKLSERFSVLFSPAFGHLEPKKLVEWMLEHRLDVRLNLQQHKFIWSPRTKGV